MRKRITQRGKCSCGGLSPDFLVMKQSFIICFAAVQLQSVTVGERLLVAFSAVTRAVMKVKHAVCMSHALPVNSHGRGEANVCVIPFDTLHGFTLTCGWSYT
jgi:hypothetical protein